MSSMKIYRRHTRECREKHPGAGRFFDRCKCSFHCDIYINGVRSPKALQTANRDEANEKAKAYRDGKLGLTKSLKEVIGIWKLNLKTRNVQTSTQEHYLRLIEFQFQPWLEKRGILNMNQITLCLVEEFRDQRALAPSTQGKELHNFKVFFGFAKKRGYIKDNPCEEIEAPEIPDNEIIPYKQSEITQILFACEQVNKSQLARTAILTMRWTGLRISDVFALRRDQVKNGVLRVFTIKNKRSVFIPIPPELRIALDAMPIDDEENPYYFWDGKNHANSYASFRAVLDNVYAKSCVSGAKNHRFRHTFISEGLAAGMTEREMSDIVGITEGVLRKHYSKWLSERQERITEAVHRLHDFIRGPKPANLDSEEGVNVQAKTILQ